MRNLLALAAAGLMLFGASQTAQSQSTDGYHSVQIFPLVVDSGSFIGNFNFVTPNAFPVTVKTWYFPERTTVQATTTGPVACNDVVIPANGVTIAVPSLRVLCPGLAPDSAFGFLHMKAADSSDGMRNDIPVFAAYSRVQNPLGYGFGVEAFPAHSFTSAATVVTGLSRKVASLPGVTPVTPAFQTNCFLGNINEVEPEGSPQLKRVIYQMRHNGNQLGAFRVVDLPPGSLVRFSDIFTNVSAPAGDYENASFVAGIDGAVPGRPGLISFCTVQDNTSYGADFRIGKTARSPELGIGSSDGHAARVSLQTEDALDRPFEVSDNSANTHIVYFKHPDTIQCSLVDPVNVDHPTLTAAAGLEMRAYAPGDAADDGVGGNNAVGTGIIYVGDKAQHDGYNNRYIIEVESNEQVVANPRKYGLRCASGSGHSFGLDIIKYQGPGNQF